MSTRTLILMRHAKSAYPGGVRDHDRPLAERGAREAGLAGEWLRAESPSIDEVLCSTAVRATQTAAATQVGADTRLAAEIYEATPDDILEQIRLTAETVHALLVVGHAPGMPGLAMELAGADSDEGALDAVQSRFPTAAMAVLKVDSEWSELDFGSARLITFHIPRS